MAIKDRAYVICHMMSTIDGKITSANGVDILSKDYFELYTKTEDLLPKHTGWMCGRVTMEMFASKDNVQLLDSSTVEEGVFVAEHSGNLYMFGVDTKGKLRWDKNLIKLTNVSEPLNLVIIVTESTPKNYLGYLREKNISYIISGKKEIDFEMLFKQMNKSFGIETLLLEGGGLINGSVMAADLVDEISLLLSPTVLNQSKAPSLFEGKQIEPLNLQHFSLQEIKKMDKDTLWIRWIKKV